MKLQITLLNTLALAVNCFAQDADIPDPTRASDRMRAALMRNGSAIPRMSVKGIVIGDSDRSGSVVFELDDGTRVISRPGTPFSVVADNQARKLIIRRITSDGIEIEAIDSGEIGVVPSFGPIDVDSSKSYPGVVQYVEFRDLPLLDALRMLSNQTGNNYSASVEANKLPVNVMLRNVPANTVVEEICKSHNLWFKNDKVSGILRIMTVTEFEKDLVGFREDITEVFTLRYPNVTEVAVAIADLFGNRVQLSLGAEENDEDMRRDLEGRFDRFDVLTQRTLQANALGGNILGSNVNGVVSNGGSSYGLGGFNGGVGGGSSYSNNSGGQYGGRNNSNSHFNRQGTNRNADMIDESFRDLTPEQAQRVQQALADGNDDPKVEALRKQAASIYVTASRRNNIVAVRTSDSRAMEDIRALINELDVQTPMVLLEVKVLSIELGKDFRSAFDYQFSDGSNESSFRRENIELPFDGGNIAGAGLNSSDMTFVIVNDNFRARMQLFEQKNRVKTIASPILLTANNEISRLFLGEERPLVRGINSQTIITDNNVATTPNTTTEFRNVGNTLLITPNINSDRTVTLRLVQENSYIKPNAASIPVVTSGSSGASSVENVPVDTVGTRSISGTFVAKDRMMVAAGGLIDEVDSDRRGQVPLLGDIPLLGRLVRRQETTKSRSELIVVIRPYVLSTPSDGGQISRDLLDRLAPESVSTLTDEGFLFPPDDPVEQPKEETSPTKEDAKPTSKRWRLFPKKN